MIGKLLCGVLALALGYAAINTAPAMLPEMTASALTDVSRETVPFIACFGKDGAGSGTGFRVSPDVVITAGHVASIGICMIDREIAQVVTLDKANDFAVLRTKTPRNNWLRIACEPMNFGDTYHALGYANGGPMHEQEVFGTVLQPMPRWLQPGFGETGMLVGREQFIPGMSGGPIVRESDGRPVGVVIGYNKGLKVSYGRFLSDTEVCRHA